MYVMKCKCLCGGVRALAVVQSAVACLCAWLSLSGKPLPCGLHTSTPSFWMSQLQQAMCNWMDCCARALETNAVLGIEGMCVEIYDHKYWKPMQTSWCALMSIFLYLLAFILNFKIYIFAEIINNCFSKYSNWVLTFRAAVKKTQPTKQKPGNLLFLLLLILFPELVGW